MRVTAILLVLSFLIISGCTTTPTDTTTTIPVTSITGTVYTNDDHGYTMTIHENWLLSDYNNTTDMDSIVKFGALYNWHAVNTGILAPAGWHVPTDAEWDTLQNYLIANGYNWDGTTTGNKIAKSMAAKTDWNSSPTPGHVGNDITTNNSSGFSALPGGYRDWDGFFDDRRLCGFWWSATEDDASFANSRSIYCWHDYFYDNKSLKEFGFSVRLLRD